MNQVDRAGIADEAPDLAAREGATHLPDRVDGAQLVTEESDLIVEPPVEADDPRARRDRRVFGEPDHGVAPVSATTAPLDLRMGLPHHAKVRSHHGEQQERRRRAPAHHSQG